MAKLDAVSQAVDLSAFTGHLKRLFREGNGRHTGAMAREIHRVGTDAAANFQHTFVLPAGELRETRDVRLDEIFSPLYFVKKLPAAGRLGRVANIARPAVPVILDLLDGHLVEGLCAHAVLFYLHVPGAEMVGSFVCGAWGTPINLSAPPASGGPFAAQCLPVQCAASCPGGARSRFPHCASAARARLETDCAPSRARKSPRAREPCACRVGK